MPPPGSPLILSYLIVLLVIGAVLGPLVAVLPSKRQRYLAVQRDYAAAQGLVVRMRELPEIPPRFRFEAPHNLMCYEVSFDPRTRPGWQPGLFVRTPEGWQSRDIERPVPALTELLPTGAVVLALGWDALRVFWDEEGGATAVDQVARVLGELRSTD